MLMNAQETHARKHAALDCSHVGSGTVGHIPVSKYHCNGIVCDQSENLLSYSANKQTNAGNNENLLDGGKNPVIV